MLNSAHLPFRVNSVFTEMIVFNVLYPTKEKHNTYNSSTLRKITVSLVSFHSMSVTTALHMFCNQVSNVFKKICHNNWVPNNYYTVAYNKRFIMFS